MPNRQKEKEQEQRESKQNRTQVSLGREQRAESTINSDGSFGSFGQCPVASENRVL